VKRLKRGLSTTHPLRTDEIRLIKAWLKVRDHMKAPATVKTLFISEQRKPLYRSTIF
jgi:type 1 fimbriae regulatory protein FimB